MTLEEQFNAYMASSAKREKRLVERIGELEHRLAQLEENTVTQAAFSAAQYQWAEDMSRMNGLVSKVDAVNRYADNREALRKAMRDIMKEEANG